MAEIELDMPRSLEHLGNEDFRDVFCEEFEANEYGLADDEYSDGGWPDFDDVSLIVDAVKGSKPRVTVSVTLEFDTVYPSACADMPRRVGGFVKYDVVLDQVEDRAYMIWTGGASHDDRDEPFD